MVAAAGRTVYTRAPATWGELVQGSIDGVDVLVTCPVDLHVQAIARAAPPATSAGGWRLPPGRPRTRAALALLPGGGQVRLLSPLRPGAGMGSSTADLCAALAAAAAVAGSMLAPADLFRRCLALEPSDGLMFPGVALVDHRRGRNVELLGAPPALTILGIDPGGGVDTAAFNHRDDLLAVNRRKEPAVRTAVEVARTALAAGDGVALAAAATLSARAHQAILPNPLWDRALALGRATGALGVNVAHSGTVLGLLYDPRRTDTRSAHHWVEQHLGLPVRHLQLVGGGVEVASAAGGKGRWLRGR